MKHLIVSAASISCFLITSLLLCSCSREPPKRLVDRYRLECFSENGKYYVVEAGKPLTGGGVFDGTVEEIGWNAEWILARVNRIYRGDTNGWYALDVKTRQITGPFHESDLKRRPALSTIRCRSSSEIFPRSAQER